MRFASTLAVAALLLPCLGCAAGDPPAPEDVALERCTSPRPQACTKEYRPACGHRCAEPPCPEAGRRTFGNACDACANADVVAVAQGSCEGGETSGVPALR